MNLKQLAQYLQMKLEQDLLADATAEAVAATAAAITQARADADAAGQDPDAAEAAVEPAKLRNIDGDVPTLEWCERIAKKHGKDAKDKVGKLKGIKAELLDAVRKDPDKKGKKAKP